MIEEALRKHRFADVADALAFEAFCAEHPDRLLFVYFFANWHPQSLQVLALLKEYLEGYLADCAFAFVDADAPATSSLASRFRVEQLPAAVLASADGELIKSLEQVDPNTVYQEIESQVLLFRQNREIQRVRALNKIGKALRSSKLVVFLPDEAAGGPQASARSRRLLALFHELGVRHVPHRLAASERDVSRALCELAKSKELPLVFACGKALGGLDAVLRLHEQGALIAALPSECVPGDAKAELEAILREARLVLLNRAVPAEDPTVAESEAAIKYLTDKLVVFRNFDLATDPRLLEYVASNVCTSDGRPQPLPQLYLDGQLLAAGPALVRELGAQPGKIPAELFGQDEFSEIRRIVGRDRVVVFIKGTRSSPECGFTSRILGLLDSYRLKYTTFDILRDDGVREKAKQFANWKTYPMLFVDGEFVGGIDIVSELIEEGEFEALIKDVERV